MIPNSDPELMRDDFWASAFLPDDPFHHELSTEFRRGILYGTEEDLRWGRMAMASITDAALWPLVFRLVQLALESPRAEFVESLGFFLSQERTLARLNQLIGTVSHRRVCEMLDLIRDLQSLLSSANDVDIASQLKDVKELLSRHA
jgi:hypothetical protein